MAVQYFTPEQAFAHLVLTHAIRTAVDTGHRVPCQTNPDPWDDPHGLPSLCAGCPVLKQCAAYADTGAVEHGVIAGRTVSPRPGRRTKPRPATGTAQHAA